MTTLNPDPALIELASVNVGVPSLLATSRDEHVWSGIRKQPVDPAAVLWLSSVNLAGDGQADLSVHGGVDKAVYAYPSEHLAAWADELEEDLGPAPFGENLSTVGVLEEDVRIGDVWSWGGAWLQVSQPRWPCFKLALHRRRRRHPGADARRVAPAGTCASSRSARCRPPGRSRSSPPTTRE